MIDSRLTQRVAEYIERQHHGMGHHAGDESMYCEGCAIWREITTTMRHAIRAHIHRDFKITI